MAIFIPLVTKFDGKGLNNATRALANFQNFAVDVGRVAATAIAAVGVASVREAAQFESSFAKIQGLVGVTADEIGELEAAARKLGPQFGISANEAAEALFFITSAGLRGAGATEVLEASLKGAAIGLGDTKTIADLATSAVNAYGEANLGGAEAVDVLAEAVRLGKLEPAELAESMGQVLPLASNLGVRFDEVGAAMAGMSKTGTDASTAATQLRQILATIAKPTAEADRALADMGLSAEGLRNQIKDEGLFATLETLTDAFDGNIEATTEVFGNIRALSGVLDLMGASVDDNRELFRLMADDITVTDEALNIVQDTAANKFAVAMETAKESLIPIGDALLENINPRLEDFSGWMEENKEPIEQGFIAIFESVDKIVGGLQDLLADDVLPFVKSIFEDERFQQGMATISAGFGVIAFEANRFVDSGVGQFLAELTRESLLGGLGQLGRNLENIGTALGIINDTINLLQGKGGTTTAEQLQQLFEDFRNIGPFGFGASIGKSIRDVIIGAQTQALESVRIPGRAGGGPVSGGSPYIVGEMGPELFIPGSSGSIIPNNRMGGSNINITVNAGMGANGASIGQEIVSAIKRYERTSGPVFASA
jgi:TP901 family phage tail tape measure protein